MGTKKIAFEVTIGVPQATVKEIVASMEEYLMDQYELKMKLKDNPDVVVLIEKSIKEHLQFALDNMYEDETYESYQLEKLFKKEIDAAEAKLRAEEEAAWAKQREANMKVSGVIRMHPDNLVKARKLLQDAGIEATI